MKERDTGICRTERIMGLEAVSMVIGNTYWWAIWHIKDDTEWTLFNNGSRRNKTEEMTKEDMAEGKKIQVLVCPKRTLRFRISR